MLRRLIATYRPSHWRRFSASQRRYWRPILEQVEGRLTPSVTLPGHLEFAAPLDQLALFCEMDPVPAPTASHDTIEVGGPLSDATEEVPTLESTAPVSTELHANESLWCDHGKLAASDASAGEQAATVWGCWAQSAEPTGTSPCRVQAETSEPAPDLASLAWFTGMSSLLLLRPDRRLAPSLPRKAAGQSLPRKLVRLMSRLAGALRSRSPAVA